MKNCIQNLFHRAKAYFPKWNPTNSVLYYDAWHDIVVCYPDCIKPFTTAVKAAAGQGYWTPITMQHHGYGKWKKWSIIEGL